MPPLEIQLAAGVRGELGKMGLQMGKQHQTEEGSWTEPSISHSYNLPGPLNCHGGGKEKGRRSCR